VAGDLVDKFVGIEVDVLAIKAAKKNAASRQILNGEFLSGRTEDLLPSLLSRFDPQKTALIIDPPRTGCPPEMLELLRQHSPGQIIYVSCHPATLARDLNILCANNVFELKNVLPLDMFPQTQHVECVANVHLTKKSP
jgi:23S rRNA (uracil1939-C5)-methyltransferase